MLGALVGEKVGAEIGSLVGWWNGTGVGSLDGKGKTRMRIVGWIHGRNV